jgi:hypothetical protein
MFALAVFCSQPLSYYGDPGNEDGADGDCGWWLEYYRTIEYYRGLEFRIRAIESKSFLSCPDKGIVS